MAGNDTYTKSLLHMDGADTSTIFTDSAAGGTHLWTANGNAQIDTAQSKFGGASGLFDGVGDWIETADSADFNFGSGDFTVDCWFKKNAGDGARQDLITKANSTAGNVEIELLVYTDNKVYVGFYDGAVYQLAISTGTLTADGNWHHVAGIRSGNNMYAALDGILGAAKDVTGKTPINTSDKCSIGRSGEYNGNYANGWIDEVRVSKGIARWIANFTPPTEAYSLDVNTGAFFQLF